MTFFFFLLLLNLVLFVPALIYMIILSYEHEFVISSRNEEIVISVKYLHPTIRKLLKITILCLPIAIPLTIPIASVYLFSAIVVDIKKIITKKTTIQSNTKIEHFNPLNPRKKIKNNQKNSISTLDMVDYLIFNSPKSPLDVN